MASPDPADSAAATGTAAVPALFVIPHAHIDPVWIWDWREGMREVLATFRAAVDRLEERPDLLFTASSAALYAWTEELDPELFERIRSLVRAGRWSLAGGQWIEPDCNLPSGESVVRQLLLGQRYFERAFGRRATIAYNIDSFGHAASLPQLFRGAGLVGYVMMRPGPQEKELPSPAFLWRGPDGTRLPTFRIPFAYNTGGHRGGTDDPSEEAGIVLEWAPELLRQTREDGSPRMFFLGVSDHGGGPTTAGLAAVSAIPGVAEGEIRFATPEAYFAAIAGGGPALPEVTGDLHLHAIGCYSALSWIKVANARAEEALATAEKLAALARWRTGAPLDVDDDLRRAWARVLFNQFHDTLGGTCTEEAFDPIAAFAGHALSVADEVTTRAAQLLSTRTDTWVEGGDRAERTESAVPFAGHFPLPVVVFNPLGRSVRTSIVLPHPASRAWVEEGTLLPLQSVGSREATRYPHHSLVLVDLPALGHQVVWLREPVPDGGADPADVPAYVPPEGRLTLDVDRERGVVASVRSPGGSEWLDGEGIHPVVLDDPSDTWSHGLTRYDAEERACELVDAREIENGPVRRLWRLTYRWDVSTIYEDVALYPDLGYVDLVVRADWHQRLQLLKLVVPLAIPRPTVTAGVPYGAVVRPTYEGEEVLNGWLDLSGESGGVACSADRTYGYDLSGSRLRLTVLRSPRYADHGRPWAGDDPIDCPVTDQGWHEASYRLLPHASPLRAAQVPAMAEEHRTRFPYVAETWHRGALGARSTGLEVSPEGVAVPAVKRAESGEGWILRVVETTGTPSEARIQVPALERAWSGSLGPFEVRTLLVPDDSTHPIREVDLAEFDR